MIVALSRAIARTVTEISKPSVTLRRAESFRLGLSMAVLPAKHSVLTITTRSLAIARLAPSRTVRFSTQENCRISVLARTRQPTHSRLPTGLATAASLSEDMTLETVFFTLFNGAMGRSKTLVHSGVAIAKLSPFPNGQVR